jgi:hypothetical protein
VDGKPSRSEETARTGERKRESREKERAERRGEREKQKRERTARDGETDSQEKDNPLSRWRDSLFTLLSCPGGISSVLFG